METIKLYTYDELVKMKSKEVFKADIIQAAWKLLYDCDPWNNHERETFCIEFQMGRFFTDRIEWVHVDIGSMPNPPYSIQDCDNAKEALRETNKAILEFIKKWWTNSENKCP
jgi:hypothetical protein